MVNPSHTQHFQPVLSRSAWKSERYARNTDWLVTLSAQHLQELRAAVDLHKDQPEAQLHELKASDFPLPTLEPVLRELREEIVNGRGFAIVQGLSTADYSLRYELFWHVMSTRCCVTTAMSSQSSQVMDLSAET